MATNTGAQATQVIVFGIVFIIVPLLITHFAAILL